MYISGWKWIAYNFNIQITLLSNAIGPLKNNSVDLIMLLW